MNTTVKETAEKILGRRIKNEEGISIAEIETVELELGLPIPPSLKEFYLRVGRIDLFTDGFEHFARPGELYIEDNKLIFLEENQSVLFWAVDIQNHEKVYQTSNLEETGKTEWYEEDLGLHKFIELMIYFQCVMGDESYHQKTSGGFEYCASLDIEEYEQNDTAKLFISNLSKEWEQTVKGSGISIFWKEGSILSYLLDEEGQLTDMILFRTKNESYLDELINEYGFGEL
ncbi:MAG: SMI1/KNR4 family protein [bacterium]|nr:SMI1/KNR4 family protein [bacterium]